MTIAFYCVLIAGLMPYAWTSVAKFSAGNFGAKENLNPREFKAKLDGFQKRAVWAEQNAFEALPFFVAAVLIAHVAGADASRIDMLAIAFIVLRLLHGCFYIADWGLARSSVWFASIGCVVALFLAAA